MPAPLPVASPPDDGIIVEFSVGDVTLAPVGPYLKVEIGNHGSRMVEPEWFSTLLLGGLFL